MDVRIPRNHEAMAVGLAAKLRLLVNGLLGPFNVGQHNGHNGDRMHVFILGKMTRT